MADAAALELLKKMRRDYPLSLHAVGLSPGSADGVDPAHLAALAELTDQLEPGLISDHLAWNTIGGAFLPDLLPMPYTEEALQVVCRNVDRIQNVLCRQLLLENPSTYLQYCDSSRSEADFLAEVVRRTGCGVLLDINNIYVSACNRGDDPHNDLNAFLHALPPSAIGEMHLAGHALTALDDGTVMSIDNHGSEVCEAVWTLYESALTMLGPRPTLIEWDTDIPAFSVLEGQAGEAQRRLHATGANPSQRRMEYRHACTV